VTYSWFSVKTVKVLNKFLFQINHETSEARNFSCDQTSGRAPCLTAFCVFVGKASSRPLDPIYSDRKNEFSFHVLIHIASSSSMAPFFSDVDLLLSFALRMRPVLLNVCFDKCDRRLVESRQKPSHPWKRLFKHYM
jgi:hypothetical protein